MNEHLLVVDPLPLMYTALIMREVELVSTAQESTDVAHRQTHVTLACARAIAMNEHLLVTAPVTYTALIMREVATNLKTEFRINKHLTEGDHHCLCIP